MRSSFTRALTASSLTLLAVLATAGSGHATTAALAAPANKASADRSLSASAIAGYAAYSVGSPTLTTDIGQPSDGAGRQLPVGIGLLAVGLLGVVYSVVTLLLPRRQRSLTPRGRLWSGA